ncbi:PA14 domain-containing protein [Spirosoma flavum]|uniref:PA14 domain-containing protein n=1 Tax=Spirosoma flavum TaxID=2048557 RepID=A0ABW6AKQ1_9BACT
MKPIAILGWLVFWLMGSQTIAQSGLKGEYYKGTNFEQKILTRIDPQLNFDWSSGGPASGIPRSYYSIRWTGKLLAPVTGQYKFYARVDDGIRVWVGNQNVMDSWQLNDSKNYTGSIVLEAGHYYDLRIDYFNDMMGGEIELYWLRPDAKKIVQDPYTTPGDPITAQYFFQKAPPIAVPKAPAKPVTLTPVVVSTPPIPKAVPQKRLIPVKPKPIRNPSPPLPPKTIAIDNSATTSPASILKPTAEPPSEHTPGTTFILHNVQFEQSSYVLLPESATELNKLVLAMKTNPLWHINIAGHTDNVGDPRLNLSLSENRAKVVASYLTRRGIDDARVTTTGYGGTRPIADNTSESERSKNRRVEIMTK